MDNRLYKEISDYKINLWVAANTIPTDYEPNDEEQTVDILVLKDIHYSAEHGCEYDFVVSGTFDPCNKWSDAGPIIENILEDLLYPITEAHTSRTHYCPWLEYIKEYNCNPLRAAMIYFLELQDRE